MPHMVNGCGTWYYGKKNLIKYEGVCSACKNGSVLTSYDTRLFVVVLMIPIIPLGRKRIIEQCGVCQRHVALPLAEWERARVRTQQAVDDWRRSPADAQRAKDAIVACLPCRDLPGLLALAPDIEARFTADAGVMKTLAGAYDIFGRAADTERTLRASLATEDSDEAREGLAHLLLQQGKPDEAEPLIAHIFDKGIPDRVGLLYFLAMSYQTKGEHEKALTAFDKCEVISPALAKDPTFVRLRETSIKNAATHLSVSPDKVIQSAKNAAAFRKFLKVAGAAAVIALIVYLTFAFAQGRGRTVYLVNGTAAPYIVKVNGVPTLLAPLAATPTRVAEGDIDLEMNGPGAALGVIRTHVSTPFLTRPLLNRTFVINPDQAAVVSQIRVYYSLKNGPDNAPEPTYTYHAGKLVHVMDGITDAFVDPPNTISTDSSSDVHRDVLRVATFGPSMPLAVILRNIEDRLGKQTVAHIANQSLIFDPGNRSLLRLLADKSEPQEFVKIALPHLTQRPVQVEWHRAYQSKRDLLKESDAVEKEYAELLAKEPDNPELMYLAARAAQDPDLSESLLESAVAGDHPSAYAYNALAGRSMVRGNFKEAISYARQSRKAGESDRYTPGAILEEGLLATGEYKALIEKLKPDEAMPAPANFSIFAKEATVHAASGDMAKAHEAIERIRGFKAQFTNSRAQEYYNSHKAMLEYIAGHAEAYVSQLDRSSSTDDRFAVAITRGELSDAEKSLPPVGDVSPVEALEAHASNHLLLYILAMKQAEREKAATHLKEATDALSACLKESRAMAAALTGKPVMPFNKLIRLHDEPQQRAVCLVALGLADPAVRDGAFALAGKLNYHRDFPHLLLADVIAHPPAPLPVPAPAP